MTRSPQPGAVTCGRARPGASERVLGLVVERLWLGQRGRRGTGTQAAQTGEWRRREGPRREDLALAGAASVVREPHSC